MWICGLHAFVQGIKMCYNIFMSMLKWEEYRTWFKWVSLYTVYSFFGPNTYNKCRFVDYKGFMKQLRFYIFINSVLGIQQLEGLLSVLFFTKKKQKLHNCIIHKSTPKCFLFLLPISVTQILNFIKSCKQDLFYTMRAMS